MKDVRRVHGFECSKGLVDEVLAVVIGKVLGSNNSVHVGFHQFLCVR